MRPFTRYYEPLAIYRVPHLGMVKKYSHNVGLQPNRGKCTAICGESGYREGSLTCDWRLRADNRAEARAAADAHMIFTHVSGGYLCGNHCYGCRAVERVCATLGVEPTLRPSPPLYAKNRMIEMRAVGGVVGIIQRPVDVEMAHSGVS